MRFITDRIRVCLFGLAIAFLGLYNPDKAVRAAADALENV
jgi:hypothetical protein